jgi:phospholipid transport system substrate-binding protein
MTLFTAGRRFGNMIGPSMRAATSAGLVWLCLLGAAAPAIAADPEEDGAAAPLTDSARDPAAIYVRSLIEDVVPHLLATSGPQRPREMRRVLEENIDLPGIARFAMGRYWRMADDGERAEFVRLFLELLVQTSTAGLADYKSETLRVAETRPAPENEVLVRSALSLQGRPPVQIDWRLRREMERFRIRDVVVEGISIQIALRDIFAAAIHEKGGTVAALLAAMRELVQSGVRTAP